MKVCVIDDNKSITGMIGKLLKMKGHESTIINDGRAGLSVLENETFDVVVLDIAMPEFSGIDIIESLSESGKIKDHKICILTASSSGTESFDYLKSKGVKETLKKPIDLNSLTSILEKVANAD